MHPGTDTTERPERRGHARVRIASKAMIRAGGRALPCDVANLSCAGGLFLLAASCNVPVAAGGEVNVQLDALGADIALAGHVVRHVGGTQIAIAFDDLTDALTECIDRIVTESLSAAECPRVVVVDPLPGERSRVAAAVRRAGMEPVEASTPLEAIDAIQRPENRVAGAAIRDSLTQTDGGELAKYLTDEHPSIPLAILSETEDRNATTTTIAGDREVPVLPIDGDISGPVRDMVKPKLS